MPLALPKPAPYCTQTSLEATRPAPSITVMRTWPGPVGLPLGLAAEGGGLDPLAVDQPEQRQGAAIGAQRQARSAPGPGARGRRSSRRRERRSAGRLAARWTRAAEPASGRASKRRSMAAAGRRWTPPGRPGRRRQAAGLAHGQLIEDVEQYGRRRVAAHAAGREAAIGPADPDADGVVRRVADGPGVAEAVGGAGLVGDQRRMRAVARRRASSAAAACRSRMRVRYQAATGLHELARRAERDPPAVKRSGRTCRPRRARHRASPDPPGSCRPRPARSASPARLARSGRRSGRPTALKSAGEAQRPDPVEQRHRRQVQRQLQRFARRQLAVKAMVEILRRVVAEAHGPSTTMVSGWMSRSSKARP